MDCFFVARDSAWCLDKIRLLADLYKTADMIGGLVSTILYMGPGCFPPISLKKINFNI